MTFIYFFPLFLLTLWAWCVATSMFVTLRDWLLSKLRPPKVSKGTYLPPASDEAEEYSRLMLARTKE